MSRHRVTWSRTSLAVLLTTALGSAQVPTALLREGDQVPAAPPGELVTGLGSTAVNQLGGYAVKVNSAGGTGAHVHFVGSATAGAPTTLRSAQSGVAGYDQTGFEDFFGIDDAGQIGYSPTCTEISSGTPGLDCAWVDSTPMAVAEQAILTLPGKKFRFNSRVGMTANGAPYWAGGINDIATNANEGNGLFLGASQTVVLKTGDPAPAPLASTLSANAADFDVRYSRNGTNYVIVIETTDPSTANTHLVSNGAILLDAGGSRISEGQLVSVAAGGDGVENWQNFGQLGINEAGDYFFAGDTSAGTTVDGFLAKNGAILYREGQTLDGLTLVGSPAGNGSYMNEQGDIAMVWDTTGSIEALYLDGALLLKEGDMVDWDGDSVLDAGTAVTDFTGIAVVSVGPALPGGTDVYFTADVNVGGPVLEGYFRIRVSPGSFASLCPGDGTQATACPCGNSGSPARGCDNSAATGGADLAVSGAVNPDTVVLTSSGELPTVLSIFLQGDAEVSPGVHFGDGIRCAGGVLKRLYVKNAVGGIVSAPQGGDLSISARSAILGDPLSPGDVRFYQVYYRDPNLGFCPDPPGNSWNVSDGVRITW